MNKDEGELQVPSITKQKEPQVMTNNKSDTRKLTLNKNTIEMNESGHKSKHEKPSQANSDDEKFRHWTEGTTIESRQLKWKEKFKYLQNLNKLTNDRYQIL